MNSLLLFPFSLRAATGDFENVPDNSMFYLFSYSEFYGHDFLFKLAADVFVEY